jgi:glycosyl transferase family 25
MPPSRVADLGARAGTRIFVISLAGSAERRRRFAERAGEARVDWRFFDACEARDDALDYRPAEARIHCGRELSAAELACYSSHYALWRRLIADDATQYMILEDDVIADWERLAMLAGVDLSSSGLPLLRLYGKTPAPFLIRKRRWLTRASHLIEFQTLSYGAQGYVVTRAAARTLLDYARRALRPIDDQIERFWDHGLPNLCLFPFPLIEEARGSTIGDERFAAPDRSLARKLFLAKDLSKQRLARLRRAFHAQDWTAKPFAGEHE